MVREPVGSACMASRAAFWFSMSSLGNVNGSIKRGNCASLTAHGESDEDEALVSEDVGPDEIFDKLDDLVLGVLHDSCWLSMLRACATPAWIPPPGRSTKDRSVSSGPDSSTHTTLRENWALLSFAAARVSSALILKKP